MDIDIDRKNRHVTISMAGYIDELFQTIRPNGTKGASTPSTYAPPNYKNPGAQIVRYTASYSRPEKRAPICDRDVTILLSNCRSFDINSSQRTRVSPSESYYQGYAQNGTTITISINSQKLWYTLLCIIYAAASPIRRVLSLQTPGQISIRRIILLRHQEGH